MSNTHGTPLNQQAHVRLGGGLTARDENDLLASLHATRQAEDAEAAAKAAAQAKADADAKAAKVKADAAAAKARRTSDGAS